jgi:hypothetical protein
VFFGAHSILKAKGTSAAASMDIEWARLSVVVIGNCIEGNALSAVSHLHTAGSEVVIEKEIAAVVGGRRRLDGVGGEMAPSPCN